MKGIVLGWGSIVVLLFVGVAALIWVNTTTRVYKEVTDKSGNIIGVANTAELVQKMLDPGMDVVAQRATWELGQTGGTETSPMWNSEQPGMNALAAALRLKLMERMPQGKYTLNVFGLDYGDADIGIGGWDSAECGPARESKCFKVTGFQQYEISDDETQTWDRVNHVFNVTVNSSYFRLLYSGRMLFENEGWAVPVGGVTINGENFTVNGVTGCSGNVAAPQTNPEVLPIKDLLGFIWRCGWGELPGIVATGTWNEAEAKNRAQGIAEEMDKALTERYGLDFRITPKVSSVDFGSDVIVRVEAKVNITDPSAWVTVLPTDSRATLGGKSYSLAIQQLLFSTASEFRMPKPAEIVQG